MWDQKSPAIDAEIYGAAVDAACNAGLPAWRRLHLAMQAATRRRCTWDAQDARDLREAERLQLWTYFGCISILDYLERELGIETRTALDRLRVSNALGELPLLESELEEGTFQYSHVRDLVRVMAPETQEVWIAKAKGKTVTQIREMVAGRAKGDGPNDPSDPEDRRTWMGFEARDTTRALFKRRRAEIESALGHRVEDEDDLWRMILESGRGEGASAPVQVSMTVCSECRRGYQDGVEVEAAEVETAMCDCDLLGSVDDEEPAKKVATVPPKRRKQVLARDLDRCTVPGCRSTQFLDVHHIRHREHGGGNELWNQLVLCRGHHRMHHRGELVIEGKAPDQLRFERRRTDDG